MNVSLESSNSGYHNFLVLVFEEGVSVENAITRTAEMPRPSPFGYFYGFFWLDLCIVLAMLAIHVECVESTYYRLIGLVAIIVIREVLAFSDMFYVFAFIIYHSYKVVQLRCFQPNLSCILPNTETKWLSGYHISSEPITNITKADLLSLNSTAIY